MFTSFLPSLLPLLSWRQNRHCLLVIMLQCSYLFCFASMLLYLMVHTLIQNLNFTVWFDLDQWFFAREHQ